MLVALRRTVTKLGPDLTLPGEVNASTLLDRLEVAARQVIRRIRARRDPARPQCKDARPLGSMLGGRTPWPVRDCRPLPFSNFDIKCHASL